MSRECDQKSSLPVAGDPTNDALIDLQSRLAFQEDLLEQLDAALISQAERIDRLERALQEALREIRQSQYGEKDTSFDRDVAAGVEVPPHY